MNVPETMYVVQLTGHGGIEKIDYRTDGLITFAASIRFPVHVSAAGMNDTNINTRINRYKSALGHTTDEDSVDGIGVGTHSK